MPPGALSDSSPPEPFWHPWQHPFPQSSSPRAWGRGFIGSEAELYAVVPADRIAGMPPEDTLETAFPSANPCQAADVTAILRERGWLFREPSAAQVAWCERAAALLG